MPTGTPVRPALYTIVEDVGAVDGGRKERFRESLDHRYTVHPPTRQLLAQLSWIWGIGGLTVAIALTVLTFALSDVDIVFTLGMILTISLTDSLPSCYVAMQLTQVYRLVCPMGICCRRRSSHWVHDKSSVAEGRGGHV